MSNIYRTNEFLNKLIDDTSNKDLLIKKELEEFEVLKKTKIRELNKILHIEDLNSSYAIEITDQIDEVFLVNSIEVVKYAVKIAKQLILPVYIAKPKNNNGKTILYLHGHDALGVKGALTINEKKESYHKNLPLRMAESGYQVVMPELLGLGEAVYEYSLKGKPAIGTCFFNQAFLTLCGYDLTAVRVWQTIKVIDYLYQHNYNTDIIFGISGGGLVCELVSVLDERIKNIVISSYVNSYKESILAKEQCIDNYIYGINQIGDSYEILALAAPKSMLLLNGNADRPFPIVGTNKAFSYIKQVYKMCHSEDKLQTYIFEGRHEVNCEIVIKWLKDFETKT